MSILSRSLQNDLPHGIDQPAPRVVDTSLHLLP